MDGHVKIIVIVYCNISNVPQSSNIHEHYCHIRTEFVCSRNWAALRAVDADVAWLKDNFNRDEPFAFFSGRSL